MRIILDGTELIKEDYKVGDMVRMDAGFFTLVEVYEDAEIEYMFMDSLGFRANGSYCTIEWLIIKSEDLILEHYPQSKWKLILKRI